MILLNEKMEDYHIGCIEEEEVDLIHKWYNLQKVLQGQQSEVLKLQEFYDCFLGSVLSEGEFFFKIKLRKKIVGVIKGRIEKKDEKYYEMWITNVTMDRSYINSEEAVKLVDKFIVIMKHRYNLYRCFAGIFVEGEYDNILWESSGFTKYRTVMNYFTINNKKNSGEILYKSC